MENMERFLTSEQINKDVYKSRISHSEAIKYEDSMRFNEYNAVKAINHSPEKSPEIKESASVISDDLRYLMDYGTKYLDGPLISKKYDFELARRN